MNIKEVRQILKVTNRTICNYVRSGKIRFTKINERHYIYNDEDVYKMIGKKTEIRINVTYARVSLNKQKKDLINQSERIYSYAISSGIPIARQYEDIKSGMNFNDRKQFNLLINEIIDKKIGTIVVENKDRLCRFGFDLFENFCKQFKTQIVVASEVESKTYEQELTDDLISIVHYFSMKSYSNRRKLNKIRLELLK